MKFYQIGSPSPRTKLELEKFQGRDISFVELGR